MHPKKSKIIRFSVICLILNFLLITSASADNHISKLAFCVTSSAIWRFVGYILLVVRVAIPVIIIVLGIVDLAKVVAGSDDDLIAKATKNLIRRFILGIAIFFVPLIVSVAMSLISSATTYMDNIEECHVCLVRPTSSDCRSAVNEAKEERDNRTEASKGDGGQAVSGAICYYCPDRNIYIWSESSLRNCTISYAHKTESECNNAVSNSSQGSGGNGSGGGTVIESDVFLNENGKDGLIEVVDGVFYIPSGVENGHENSKGSGPHGYNIFFYNRLVKFIDAAKEAGYTISMCETENCAWRPYSKQEYFYGCYINKNCNNGNLAAEPGTSNHGWGIASDLNYNGSTAAVTWAHNNAAAYGLAFTVDSENWHIEPLKRVKR